MVIALVGSVDTLLTALVGDSMTRTRTDPSRELLAQGIGNVFTGFIRGLPGSGATPSTVANIRAGGATLVSGVLSVAILVVMILMLGDYVGSIPNAVLAGILVKVALDTIDWRFVTRMHRVQREHLVVMLLHLRTYGVSRPRGRRGGGHDSSRRNQRTTVRALGAGQRHLRSSARPRLLWCKGRRGGDRPVFGQSRPGGAQGTFTVASSSKLIDTIGGDIRDHEVVILDFSDTVYMDDSAALVVEQLVETAVTQDTPCIVMGLSGTPAHNLHALDVLKRVPDDQIVGSWDEARETALGLLGEKEA